MICEATPDKYKPGQIRRIVLRAESPEDSARLANLVRYFDGGADSGLPPVSHTDQRPPDDDDGGAKSALPFP